MSQETLSHIWIHLFFKYVILTKNQGYATMFIDGVGFCTGDVFTHRKCFTFQKLKKVQQRNRDETATVIQSQSQN